MTTQAVPVPAPASCGRAPRARYDAIVIGSGVGGATAAGLLAHEGDRVLVLEKNPVFGGILASYRRDGFKIDFGSHLISRGARGPLGTVLRRLGADRPRFLTHSIPMRSRGMLEVTAPPQRHGLLRVALQTARALHLPPQQTLRVARMVVQIFTLTESELRRWDRRTLDAFLHEHIDVASLYFLFSFLASIFFVLPPWRVSAGESIRCLRWLLQSYSLSYVEGGMDSLAHALLAPVAAAGGDIVVGHRAVSIRKRAAGWTVATDDGAEYAATDVVCNMAPFDALALLDDVDVPADYAARISAVEPSGNAHQVKLALCRPLVDEGCLIAGVSREGLTLDDLSVELMHQTVERIETGALTDPLAIYATVPTNYDPSLAPPGRQLIVASIYGPVRDDPIDSPERWRDRSIELLAHVIPGLEDELLFADFTPISDVGAWMGKSSRGAICNGQVPGQVGADRLGVSTPLAGLFLCGDGAGGRGIGTELAATSAMQAVEEIWCGRATR